MYNENIPVLGRDYKVKLGVIPDLHIPHKEPRNRVNLIAHSFQIFDEIIELVDRNKLTGVIFLGDIANASWSGIDMEFVSEFGNRLARLYSLVRGNLFCVYGNHEDTHHRNNPFFSFASIDNDVVERQIKEWVVPKLITPYLRTPAKLEYGVTSIYLVHYDKSKQYRIVDETAKNVVGCYHDDFITFESSQELYHHKIGNGIRVDNSNVFDYVDWAILGHIHTPLATFDLGNSKNTTIDVPGSMLQNKVTEIHERVKIPIICLDGEDYSELYKEYLDFSIGEITPTVNEAIVKEDKAKKVVRALFKEKDNIVAWENFSDYLSKITDISVRELIAASDNQIKLKCVEMFENREEK